jgi:hypothetical protein
MRIGKILTKTTLSLRGNGHAAYPKTPLTLAKETAKEPATPSCHNDLGLIRMISRQRSPSLKISPKEQRVKEKALPFEETMASTKRKPPCLKKLGKKRPPAHGSPPPMGEPST